MHVNSLQLRKSLSEVLNGSVAYIQSERDGSDYKATQLVTPATGVANYGGYRVSPVNTADRDREKIRATLDWSPLDNLGVQLVAESSKDDYGTSARPDGLTEGEGSLYSLDVSYQMNDDWQVSGWYSVNTNKAQLQNFPAANPNLRHQEQNDTGNAAGFNLTGTLTEKSKVGAEFLWSEDETEFKRSNSTGATTGLTNPAPDITAKLQRITLFATYALNKQSGLRFDVAHERWDTDDWQWTFSNGTPFQFASPDSTKVLTEPEQDATFVSMRYTYQFQ